MKATHSLRADVGAERTGILPGWLRAHWWDVSVGALLLFTLVSRAALRGTSPFNMDSVNYILALDDFDLARQQPHPPGNPIYVLLGRAANQVIADPNQALIALSILFSLIAVWGTTRLGAEIAGKPAGLWAGALLAVNPFFWINGEVALTYAGEAAGAVLVALAAWESYRRPGMRAAVLLGLSYALMGGLRPTLLPLLGAVYLFGLVRLSWRLRGAAVAVTLAVCVLWLVPLVWLAGGLASYRALLQAQARIAGSRSSIVYGIGGWLANLGFFTRTLVVAVNLLGLPVVVALARGRFLFGRPSARAVLLWLWLLPAAATYVFVHFGQIGYVLLILPPVILLCLLQVERAWPRSLAPRRPSPWLVGAILGSVLLALPMISVIRDDNAAWDVIRRQVEGLPPAQTLILARVTKDGSYRVASYLFHEYHVVGVDGNREGEWVPVYEVRDGHSTLRIDGPVQRICTPIPLGEAAYVVVLDEEVAAHVADASRWSRTDLPNGMPMLVRRVPGAHMAVDFTSGLIRLVATGAIQPGSRCES